MLARARDLYRQAIRRSMGRGSGPPARRAPRQRDHRRGRVKRSRCDDPASSGPKGEDRCSACGHEQMACGAPHDYPGIPAIQRPDDGRNWVQHGSAGGSFLWRLVLPMSATICATSPVRPGAVWCTTPRVPFDAPSEQASTQTSAATYLPAGHRSGAARIGRTSSMCAQPLRRFQVGRARAKRGTPEISS